MKTILSSIGFFLLALLQQAHATTPPKPPSPGAVSCVAGEDDKPNLIAARMFGQWKGDLELTRKFGPFYGDAETEVTLVQDENVLALFDLSFGCAHASGTMTLIAKHEGQVVFGMQSPFILVIQNGNPLLIVDEGGYDGEGPIEHPHRNYISLAAAPDAAHDLLFVGKHVGKDFLVLGRAN